MNKYLPVDDDISKRVEKVESVNKQKEKNRVVEYLIMVSAEMTNSIASKPHRLCQAHEVKHPEITIIQSNEDNIIIPD